MAEVNGAPEPNSGDVEGDGHDPGFAAFLAEHGLTADLVTHCLSEYEAYHLYISDAPEAEIAAAVEFVKAEWAPFAAAVAAGGARGGMVLAGDIYEAMQRAYDDGGYHGYLIERGIAHPSNQTYRDYWMEHGSERGITLGYDALEQLRRGEAWVDPKVAKPPAEPTIWPEFRNARAHLHTSFAALKFAWHDRLLAFEPNLVTGEPGAGKTTLALNEAVCIAAGIPLFGFATMPMHVFLLIGEDLDGTVRDNLARIQQELGLDEDVLDRIDWLSVKSAKVPGGHSLATISDMGAVTNTAFLRESIVPQIQCYEGPVLFIVDPLASFVTVDRNKPLSAGAIGRVWAEELCLLNSRQVTVQINDHPSNASMDSGRHVSGDVQFRGGFSLTATLIGEKIAEAGGIKQKKLTYRTLKPRGAAETETVLYRIASSPLLKAQPAKELALAANMARVYRHIEERRASGLQTFTTAGNGKVERHTPDSIAYALHLPSDLVKAAIKRLIAASIYRDERVDNSVDPEKRGPGGLVPTAMAGQFPLDKWDIGMFIDLAVWPRS